MTGALDAELRHAVAGLPCHAVHNLDWAVGMGSSIRAGLAALAAARRPVLMMSCDQPLTSVALLRKLAQRQRTSKALAVATAYAGSYDIPVLFAAEALEDLRAITVKQGAKPLLARYGPALELVGSAVTAIDVDIPAAYEALLVRRAN